MSCLLRDFAEVGHGSNLLTAADYERKRSRMNQAVQLNHSLRSVVGHHAPGPVREVK